MNKSSWLCIQKIVVAASLLVLLLMSIQVANASTPVFDIWYGDRQEFGQNGVPQEWVNILGNVSDPDGIASLSYMLNGTISGTLVFQSVDAISGIANVGPDTRRLDDAGDFNVEILYADLSPGENELVLTATDMLSNTVSQTVTVVYNAGNTLPLDYVLDWSTVATLTDVVQVIDGKWVLEGDSIRPVQFGYDRLFTLGDLNGWTNYEVTVPITVHQIDPDAPFGPPSGGPGVGMLVRWQGHDRRNTEQPAIGWKRHGALGWHRWFKNSKDELKGKLVMARNITETVEATDGLQLEFGVGYNFKLRAVTQPDNRPYYHFKVWQREQAEPLDWDKVSRGNDISTDNGSLLFLAHHVDASFGNIAVKSITNLSPALTTNQTGNGRVDLDPPPTAFPDGYPYGTLITVTAASDVNWSFAGWEGVYAGKPRQFQISLTDDITINAAFKQDESGIVSDDFNSCALDESVWTYIDLVNQGGSQTSIGTDLLLSVPAGTEHNLWKPLGNQAVRVVQNANNKDFEIEVKFNSGFGDPIPIQGLLVEQDADNFLRFDFYRKNNGTPKIFAAIFATEQDPVAQIDKTIADQAPMYMRIQRIGNQWTQSYSFDGQSWLIGAEFEHTLTVQKVGVYAGNAGDAPPQHTSMVDYFFNTAAPIDPEDAEQITITTTVTGEGTIALSPEADFACNRPIAVTAQAAPGFVFDSWGGAMSGNTNPGELVVTSMGAQQIIANFVASTQELFLPFIGR